MPSSKVDNEISTLIRARYPIIYVVSWEERRVEDAIAQIARPDKKLYTWSATSGIQPAPPTGGPALSVLAALEFVEKSTEDAVFMFKDLHPSLADGAVIRRLRDLAHQLKGAGGGYGYPVLTEAGKQLEGAARAHDREAAGLALGRLAALVRAVTSGRFGKTDTKVTSHEGPDC